VPVTRLEAEGAGAAVDEAGEAGAGLFSTGLGSAGFGGSTTD
jgi:hypothetical protein